MAGPALAPEDRAEKTLADQAWRREYDGNPAIRLAVRALASGAVRTKKEAAMLAGVSVGYFSALTADVAPSASLTELMTEIEQQIHDRTIQLSTVISLLSREAVEKALDIMRSSKSEALQLKAAQDFMDRDPTLSKTQRHIVTSFSLDGQDAKELAAVLVETAAMRGTFKAVEEGDYVTVDTSKSVDIEALSEGAPE